MKLTNIVRTICFSFMLFVLIGIICLSAYNFTYQFRKIDTDVKVIDKIDEYKKAFKEKIKKIKMSQSNYDPNYYQRVMKITEYIDQYPYEADKDLFKNGGITIRNIRKNIESEERKKYERKYFEFNSVLDNTELFLFDNVHPYLTIKLYNEGLEQGVKYDELEIKSVNKAQLVVGLMKKDLEDYMSANIYADLYKEETNSFLNLVYNNNLFYDNLDLSSPDNASAVFETSLLLKYELFDSYLDFLLGVGK